MKITDLALSHIAKQYTHSLDLVKAFVPLLNAREDILLELPEPELPKLDLNSFVQGKPWLLPDLNQDLYLDDVFLEKAPAPIAEAIKEGFPDLAKDAEKLGNLLCDDRELCRNFVLTHLKGAENEDLAKKYKLSTELVKLFAIHLSCVAAERIARAASKAMVQNEQSEKSKWTFGYCPICGGHPHASCLKNKEGQRFLQCSLCSSEWIFSRTACPMCGQDALKELPIYYLKEKESDRAEACEVCKHYILGVDLRASAGEIPLSLFLLCMMPLDILMQEKGYSPILNSSSQN